MRYLKIILKISWDDIRYEKITNEQVNMKFNDIKDLENQITKRRLTFLVKTTRISREKTLARLISGCCFGKKTSG